MRRSRPVTVRASLAALALAAGGPALLAPAAAEAASTVEARKVLRYPVRTDGPRTLDPARGSTTYDNLCSAQILETLLINSYVNPSEMEPLLLAGMPTTADGGRTWRFTLKEGVTFHDDECFPGGEGRAIRTDDVFYSLMRLVDADNGLKNDWLLRDTIVGLDDYAAAQNAKGGEGDFDYDGDVPGFRKINDLEFEIELVRPVSRFLWVLSMFQTSIMPREAVEHYGKDIEMNPVGTGPFRFVEWQRKQNLVVERNPEYHDVRYPDRDEWSRDLRRRGLHRAGGEKVPFLDGVEFIFFGQDQPMWLQFDAGEVPLTQVPAEYFDTAFDKRTRELKPDWQRRGVDSWRIPLLDFIFMGFNMEDELLGGYDEKKIKLRRAIHLAIDLDERNETFYNGTVQVYDGMIPPGLAGYPENGESEVSWRGPNLALARQYLAEAGYPNGEGLPPIRYYTDRSGNSAEQAELLKRQLSRIGVQVDAQLVDFSTLIEYVNQRRAPFFSFAWSSDYPDGENNLALFYGPNESPGSNHYNYQRDEYDRMYEQILVMQPGPERTAIMERMRDMVVSDCAYVGSLARTRSWLVHPWLENCKPTEMYYAWLKFLDMDPDAMPGG